MCVCEGSLGGECERERERGTGEFRGDPVCVREPPVRVCMGENPKCVCKSPGACVRAPVCPCEPRCVRVSACVRAPVCLCETHVYLCVSVCVRAPLCLCLCV